MGITMMITTEKNNTIKRTLIIRVLNRPPSNLIMNQNTNKNQSQNMSSNLIVKFSLILKYSKKKKRSSHNITINQNSSKRCKWPPNHKYLCPRRKHMKSNNTIISSNSRHISLINKINTMVVMVVNTIKKRIKWSMMIMVSKTMEEKSIMTMETNTLTKQRHKFRNHLQSNTHQNPNLQKERRTMGMMTMVLSKERTKLIWMRSQILTMPKVRGQKV